MQNTDSVTKNPDKVCLTQQGGGEGQSECEREKERKTSLMSELFTAWFERQSVVTVKVLIGKISGPRGKLAVTCLPIPT